MVTSDVVAVAFGLILLPSLHVLSVMELISGLILFRVNFRRNKRTNGFNLALTFMNKDHFILLYFQIRTTTILWIYTVG